VRKQGLFLMEGPRFICDYLSSGKGNPEFAVMSRECTSEALSAAERLTEEGVEILCVPGKLLSEITDTAHGQGLAAVCPLPACAMEDIVAGGPVLVLDRISDPGNVGTAIRSAAAFGTAGVVCGKGTCFPFIPAVTRAAAGLNSAVPVLRGVETARVLRGLADAGYTVLAADSQGTPVGDADLPDPGRTVLVVGSEAHGLSAEAVEIADLTLSIPMNRGVESLNAGVSAAILLYVISTGRS
jgi:TrmH family RNA methyltransferase